METIPSVLQAAALAFGNEDAVVDGRRRLSFTELRDAVEVAARALVATGLRRGDRVAIWAPNSTGWIEASLAVYAAGCVLVPLNTRYKGDEAAHVLRTSGARLLVTVSDFEGVDYLGMLGRVTDTGSVEEKVVLSGPAPDGVTPWDVFL